jgi:hypothetical protein
MAAKFNRRHYEMVASALHRGMRKAEENLEDYCIKNYVDGPLRDRLEVVAANLYTAQIEEFASAFKYDNPLFNKDKFEAWALKGGK